MYPSTKATPLLSEARVSAYRTDISAKNDLREAPTRPETSPRKGALRAALVAVRLGFVGAVAHQRQRTTPTPTPEIEDRCKKKRLLDGICVKKVGVAGPFHG